MQVDGGESSEHLEEFEIQTPSSPRISVGVWTSLVLGTFCVLRWISFLVTLLVLETVDGGETLKMGIFLIAGMDLLTFTVVGGIFCCIGWCNKKKKGGNHPSK